MGTMKSMYEMAFEGWKTDSARFWTLFSVMSVLNGALLASLSLGGGENVSAFADWRVAVSLLGIVLCLIWHGIQKRMASWCKWWDERLEQLEPAHRLANDAGPDAKIFEGRKAEGGHPGLSTPVAGWMTPLLFGVVWLIVANRELKLMNSETVKAVAGLSVVLTSPLCLYLGTRLLLAARKKTDDDHGWIRYTPGCTLCIVGVILAFRFAWTIVGKAFP
jgi:hypothetical protein